MARRRQGQAVGGAKVQKGWHRNSRAHSPSLKQKQSPPRMPPALSDDELESDGPDEIPAKAPARDEDVAEDEDDEDEDDAEEYRVEKILDHGWAEDGTIIYQIKWLGYDKKADLTWEPTENLANAVDLLNEYHDKIGGIPQPPEKKKKGGKGAKGGKRSAATAFPDSPAVQTSAKKGRKNTATNGAGDRDWTPPNGSWEEHVTRVSSIIEEIDAEAQGGKGTTEKGLFGLLEWNNGKKTQFPLDTVRRKCPQRLLDYYEEHLVFRQGGGAEEAEEE